MSATPERFASEHDEAQHWLGILKDGSKHQRTEARLRLARIFEARDMPAEAIELLVTCIRAGHREPEAYDSLARLYAAQHRPELSVRARAEAGRLRGNQRAAPPVPEPTPSGLPMQQTMHQPAVISWGLLRIVVGAVLMVGGFVLAESMGGGGWLMLYGLPIAGVVILLRGLATLLPRPGRH